MQRLSTRGVGLLLGVLTIAALAANLYRYVAYGELEPIMLLPAAGLLVLLVSLPFLSGWRPYSAPADRLDACKACGTLWSPVLDGTPFCPACGGKTAARAG